MNLIRNQLLEMKKIDKKLSLSVLVIVIGYDLNRALLSLKKQIYTNFRTVYVNENYFFQYSGEINLSDIEEVNVRSKIADLVKSAKEDFVYIIDGCDMLFDHSLLEYVRFCETHNCDLAYADECRGDGNKKEVYYYELKPQYEQIAMFQSLCSGRAVIFNREKLSRIIDNTISTELDTLLRELFMRCIEDDWKIGHIPLILLLKAGAFRNANEEKKLIPLIQKNITKYTKWTGQVTRTNSYNQFAFEMTDVEEPCSIEFLIIEEDLNRIKQLISQIGISYHDKRTVIAAQREHIGVLIDWCSEMGISDVTIIERERSYTASIEKLAKESSCEVQILFSDQVQWINRMNVQRLIAVFHKQEVKVACPQVATEGEESRLVYAGGDLNSLALTSNYLKGREQSISSEFDLAWMSRKAINLTSYCLAVRKEIWEQIFPMHPSIWAAWQFAVELSFLCRKKDIICEYAAQSAVWVNSEIEKWYVEDDDEVKIEQNLREMRCSGYFWHFLSEYGDFIEASAEKMHYAQRSYRRYLRESFRVFGLNNVKETGQKRVLVFTHELSLTGAPLVLVQAVECLKKMDYDVLVVSPSDGPLRETYLGNNVPVIIEPELFSDFEYIRIAYDFDFVITCTVCLWQVIKVLGKTDIPVLWWVHDSRMGYVNWLRYVLPETIGNNIHLYCGGDYAQKVILEYRPRYSSKILLYGLDDYSDKIGDDLKRDHWNIPEDKIAFANIGQIISRKGQDILIAAIKKLPEELLRQSIFIFVGGVVDRKIYNEIMELREQYPENIYYIPQISHDDLKQFYREVDCIICSSVDDPLPAFVAEGLMMSKVCICSTNTAFNGLISDGENGYLFESGNADMLYDKLVAVISERQQLGIVKKNARELYENTFTSSIFQDNFSSVIKEVME